MGSKEAGEWATAQLAALEAARLLEGSTEILVAREGRGEPAWDALRPGDIAVLVRTNGQAARVRDHLERLGIPAVSAGRGRVTQSPALDWLCLWLEAVAEPARDVRARALAASPLFGWRASELAAATEGAEGAPTGEAAEAVRRWADWVATIRGWSASWGAQGFVRVFEGALDEFGVLGRLLGAPRGERHATDLRHLVELCHAHERRTRLGPAGLASWLRAARQGGGDEEAEALRLESDARAVQLVTVHKSKGLEYPVVLLPFAWSERRPRARGPIAWHARVGERTEVRLNLEPPGTRGRERAAERAAREHEQENLRLLYVALTRARHHCVAWLGPLGSDASDMGAHALGKIVLRARGEDGAPLPEPACPVFPRASARDGDGASAGDEAWEEVAERLERLARTSKGTIGWSREPPIEARPRLHLSLEATGPLEARPWPARRSLQPPWRVTSYSAMVSGRTFDASEPQRLEERRATGAPLTTGGEPAALPEPTRAPVEPLDEAGADGLDAPIPTRELGGGTAVGSWAHAVLEGLDFQAGAARDGRSLEALISELGARHGVRSERQHELLAAALPLVLDTPLDGSGSGLPAGFSLRALPAGDRLDELGFDLRLGGGSRPGRGPGAAGLLNEEGCRLALRSRRRADDGGTAEWGGDAWLGAILEGEARGGEPVLPRIAGILTGFIDLTFRVELPDGPAGGGARYFVSDYKTNRIVAPGAPRDSRLRHYTRPWLAFEMARHGYHLQALLYTVALHRLLRQRLPGYSYDEHVGGHLYLFLRGMVGADAPRHGGLALGVYFDRWPASVVLGLDAALSGAPTGEVRAIVEGALAGEEVS